MIRTAGLDAVKGLPVAVFMSLLEHTLHTRGSADLIQMGSDGADTHKHCSGISNRLESTTIFSLLQ